MSENAHEEGLLKASAVLKVALDRSLLRAEKGKLSPGLGIGITAALIDALYLGWLGPRIAIGFEVSFSRS